MAIEKVRNHLKRWGKESQIREFPVSSATVGLAAQALGVAPERIAKSLTFEGDGRCLLIVAAGDGKIDNAKFKARFQRKAKMLAAEQALAATGHAIGGVCPFALPDSGVEVYLDVSLQRFDTVFPACGSANSAIELTCEELFELSGALDWIDVCKLPEA